MAKGNDNSDFMSRRQDDRLEQLEEKLTALYANAENEIRSEFTDFSAKFQKEDKIRADQVEAGQLSEDDYLAWRKTQILKSTDYSKAIESMSNMLVNTDIAAMATINGELPGVVAESYDFVQALGFQAAEEAGITTGTFQVYNEKTVEMLVRDNPDLLPKPSQNTIERLGGTVDIPEDKKWAKDRINREITQGIVQGKSMQDIAKNLKQVAKMDRSAAIRNARTAMTGAENMGRAASAADLKKNGIPVQEVWSAAGDNRVRETHALMDGTIKNEAGYYGEGIIEHPLRYPGDPLGDPEEVYNCRCRESIVLQGIDHSQDEDLYEEFMKQFEDGQAMVEKEKAPEPEPAAEISTKEKVEVMELYTAEEGFAMNAYARGDDISEFEYLEHSPEEIAAYTDKFTEILEKERLDEETSVYRGATFDTLTESTGLTEEQIRENPELLIGQTITEHGFMSTTPDYETAESYANGNVLMKIDLPEGAKAIDQNEYLGTGLDSKELTIQRDCDMQITKCFTDYDETGNEIIVIQAEYIDAGLDKEAPEPIATSGSENQQETATVYDKAIDYLPDDLKDNPAAQLYAEAIIENDYDKAGEAIKDLSGGDLRQIFEAVDKAKEETPAEPTPSEKAPEKQKQEPIETFETKTFSNGIEATEYFIGTGSGDEGQAETWVKSCSFVQRAAVNDYTGDAYEPVNNYLRGIWNEEKASEEIDEVGEFQLKEEIKLIDEAIEKYNLEEAITVHRTCEQEFVDQLEVGATFHDDGYGSTTVVDQVIASGNVYMEIDVPAGQGVGAYVDGISEKKGEEFEFLLARGANYAITEKEIRKDGIYVKAVITGYTPKEI